MTDKELRRLTRADLLELLIIERQEIDRLLEDQNRLTADLDSLSERLENISIELAETQKFLSNSVLLKDRIAAQE